MMNRMGWAPGQTLGLHNKGLKAPISSSSSNTESNSELKNNLRPGDDSLNILNQIIYVLKLKIEQNQLEEIETRSLNTVFEEDTEVISPLKYKSEILVQVFEYEVIALVDTGSDITCMSESFFHELRVKYENEIPIMPIKPFQIKTAVGHKSVEIRSIALMSMKIGTQTFDTTFLIVPGLVNQMILGFDWLNLNEATINLRKQNRGIRFKQSDEKELIKFYDCENEEFREELKVTKDVSNIEKEKLKDLKIGVTLTFEEREKLGKLLTKYKNLFSGNLGRANCYQHEIVMKTEIPTVRKTYPVPYAYRQKVEKKLREMEEQNIISRTTTPYCSPLTFTMKKDGSIRVLLDAREINKNMIAETEKPPMQIDVLNSFHGANFISIIDLNNAYFQIPLTENSRKYTGFTFNGKSYVYNVLPQGLKTSVGSFSRAMDIILGHEVREYCVNYLDDLAIITTGTLDDHLEHLDIVLGKLNKAGLTCNLEKSEYFCKEVKMLGFIISTEGLRTDPDKVKAIKEFPVPKKVKQVRAFLGLCNFYRRFIPKFSMYIQPLCELLKKGTAWTWGIREQQALDNIKKLFIDTIQLSHPDFEKPYYLQTDSSGIGMAGILYQTDKEGQIKIMGFHSKALRGAQLNWTVTEQEFYAVINCLEKFETYLRGSKVIIRTDHKALTFVKNWRLYNARVSRWINYLENFQYEVQHIKGKENIAADILSRYPPESDLLQEDKVKLPEILYMETRVNRELINKLKNIKHLQEEDPDIRKIIERVKSRQGGNEKIDRITERCEIYKDILYFKPGNGAGKVIYLPKILRDEVIQQVHIEMGHQGTYKVIKYVRDRFYWRGITRQVKQKIRTCHKCQMVKSDTMKRVGPCKSIITKEIGELVMVDLYGPLPAGKFGMSFILVIQDSFSKFVKFYELRKATSRSVISKMKNFFSIIKPQTIMSDNGAQFASRLWKDSMQELGIKVIYTTVRNPRPNTTERVNKELGRLFRTYSSKSHKSWVSVLPKLEILYNNTFHESIKFTPCEVMYGESTRLTFDNKQSMPAEQKDVDLIRKAVRENLQESGKQRRAKFNQKYRLVQFQVGDLVKIRKLNKSDAKRKITKKFEPLYEGPYLVARVPNPNVYLLMDPNTKEIRGKFNAIHLSRYYTERKNGIDCTNLRGG